MITSTSVVLTRNGKLTAIPMHRTVNANKLCVFMIMMTVSVFNICEFQLRRRQLLTDGYHLARHLHAKSH